MNNTYFLFITFIQVTIGNKVGRTKHMRIMPGGALEQEGTSPFYVGRKLDEHRGAFLLEYPMDKGYVTSGGWDAMERVWQVRFFFFFVLFDSDCFFK